MHKAFHKYQVKFELVPLHIHHHNAAERAIQTWEKHFLAAIYSIDPDLTIKEWDHLIFQSEITINLLSSSHRHTKLSAWAAVFGRFDFNCTPLSPPDTQVLFHKTPY